MAGQHSATLRENSSFLIDSVVRSYGVVFFSQRKSFGLLIALATFLNPLTGLIGLFAILSSNAIAFILGLERQKIRKGYYGFNALLVALALTFFYAPSLNLLILTFLGSVITTLFAEALQRTFWHYLRLPALSLPFVIGFSIVVSASFGFGKLEVAESSMGGTIVTTGFDFLDLFLKSIGAVLFQVDVFSGAIILIAFLLHSRIGVLLGLAGFAAGYATHAWLGAYPQVLTEQYLGFNYVLTGIALGGIFLIPSAGALLLAVIAASASALIMLSSKVLLPEYLSPTAIPFNIITLLVLYSLKQRLVTASGLQLSAVEASTPEENLSTHRANLKQFRRWGVEVMLPFNGTWSVTQGFNGGMTHKEDWRFAIDFVVPGARGKLYKGSGAELSDYVCFGVPVLAAAEGTVVYVKSDVHDNHVGAVNERENWGNAVIIEHAPHYYSCVAHLKKGSIPVKMGERVRAGQVIGQCGNSGRSPYPHLHFQMQNVPAIGAPTLHFEFAHYVREEAGKKEFMLRGEPKERDVVMKLHVSPHAQQFFPYSFAHDFIYSVKREGAEQEERWQTEIDFHGNLSLVSSPVETRMYFTMDQGVLSVKKLEGSSDTGLYHVGELLTDVPLVTGETFAWTSFEEADDPLPRGMTALLDLLAVLGISFKFKLANTLHSTQHSIKLTSNAQLVLRTPVGSLRPSKRIRKIGYTFARPSGLTHFEGNSVELELKETIERKEDKKA